MTKRERRQSDHESLPVRLVIWFVGIIGLLALLNAAWLGYNGKEPGSMITIVMACVTGLLALLGKTERRDQTPVPVVNPPGEVLETKETGGENEIH